AGAGADPPMIGRAEAHAAFDVELDGRVALRERGVAGDVVALDSGLAEDRGADAVLAVLERGEPADRPSRLVADAETGTVDRIVDGMIRTEVDARVRGQDEELYLRLGGDHHHRADLVVTAEVRRRAGGEEEAELRAESALSILGPRDDGAKI